MGKLETIMFILWVVCCIIQLALAKDGIRFIIGCVVDAFVLGFIYVILHFAIKYW